MCLPQSANYFQLRSHLRGNDIFCFSDVTQPVRNIFMQNDSRPCPSLHGHHSTSLTMPQGKMCSQDVQGHVVILYAITSFKTKSVRARVRAQRFNFTELKCDTKCDDDSNYY